MVGSYRCECPSHLKLHKDGKSCKGKNMIYMMACAATALPLNAVDFSGFNPHHVTVVELIVGLVFEFSIITSV